MTLYRNIAVLVLLFSFSQIGFAQGTDDQSHFNLNLFQPGAFVYEDLGKDDEGEIDLYVDGHPQFSLQLIGVDLLTKGSFRFGVGLGAGFSKPSSNAADTDAVLGVFNGGLVLQLLRDSIRLEVGFVYGRSFKEVLNKTQRDDSALYFGISLPTKIGEAILGKN